MRTLLLIFCACFSFLLSAQPWYVNPDAATNGAGTAGSPFNDIELAVQHAADNGGGDVLVPGGTYELTRPVSITTAATAATEVTIKPVPGEMVKFNFGVRSAFNFELDSKYITLQGFEIDGNTDQTDFWCVVAQDFWSNDGNPDGGGLAVIIDGEDISILDNYFHHCYQKGVEIRSARYAIVKGNIIHDIATSSLSGGHGVMRQQKGQEFMTDDLMGKYRWDIRENLLFNISQRIYSWVPSKGFIEMVIDEGKSILIDDPKDTDGIQERMSARIKNNVVAFGVVDHIRLKSTPNLEVSNNSIYSLAPEADGITDKGGDTDTPKYSSFIGKNNAAQVTITPNGVTPRRFAIEMDDCIDQSTENGGVAAVISNNYSLGRAKPNNNPGITQDMNEGQLFVSPNTGDFSINTAAGYPADIGVEPAVLAALAQRATDFGVSIGWDGFLTDNLKLSQTILDNIPGINDGVAGNETVFTDDGSIAADYHKIVFQVVDGVWKSERNSPNTQDFELNDEYVALHTEVLAAHLNAAGGAYPRLRWGDSEVKQDQLFEEDWLTVSQITQEGNTLINGYDNDFILDGDLLVDFENYTPSIGETFDLITAGSISGVEVPGFTTSTVATDLFDRVIFEGFTPDDYSIEVVDLAQGQAARLTILGVLPVEMISFTGEVVSKSEHLLQWETSQEEGNDFFEVQRSSDGLSWQVLGQVAGAGNSLTDQAYGYTDYSPLPTVNLYRLRQVGFDGFFEYSSILQLNGTGSGVGGLAFPNPFVGRLVIPFSDELQSFHIYSVDGRELTQEVNYRTEEGRIVISGENLPSGSYVIRYNDKVTVALKKQ